VCMFPPSTFCGTYTLRMPIPCHYCTLSIAWGYLLVIYHKFCIYIFIQIITYMNFSKITFQPKKTLVKLQFNFIIHLQNTVIW